MMLNSDVIIRMMREIANVKFNDDLFESGLDAYGIDVYSIVVSVHSVDCGEYVNKGNSHRLLSTKLNIIIRYISG